MNTDTLAAIIAVGSLVTAYFALGATRSSADVTGYRWCYDELRRTYDVRNAIIAAGPEFATWSAELRRAAHQMISTAEEVGAYCLYGAVTKRTIIETCAWTVLDCWILSHELIKTELRQARGQPREIARIPRIGSRRLPFIKTDGALARRQFELIARECAAYLKQHHRSAYGDLVERRRKIGFEPGL